jgi:hypothetical protein
MHARESVDVAGLIALNGPLLVCGRYQPHALALEQYWSTSKLRFESWMRALKSCAMSGSRAPRESSPENFDAWIAIRATLDEIFTTEILTRVWTAVLVASDRRAKSARAESIARSVLASHHEARHGALELLVRGDRIGVNRAASVNRLRRRAERWTDLLIGGLLHVDDLREFAVEAERAEDFAFELDRRGRRSGGDQAWKLALVSMRNAFQQGLSPVAANPDANARLAASILGCLPEELFDTSGVFHSLWMMRLTAATSDAQGMIDDLVRGGWPADGRPRGSRTGRRL